MTALTISRKVGESIVIVAPTGERVGVSIERSARGRLRLVVDAPASHLIHRGEVLARIEAERARTPLPAKPGEAAQGGGSDVPLCAIGPDSTDRLKQHHRPTGS